MRGKFSSGTLKKYKKSWNLGSKTDKQDRGQQGWIMLFSKRRNHYFSSVRSDVIYNLKISSKVTNKEGN